MRFFAALAILAVAIFGAAAAGVLTFLPAGEEADYFVLRPSVIRAKFPSVPADAPTLYVPKEEVEIRNSNALAPAPGKTAEMNVQALGDIYGNPNDPVLPTGCIAPYRRVYYQQDNTTAALPGYWCSRDCTVDGFCAEVPEPALAVCGFYSDLNGRDYCGVLCESVNTSPSDCAFLGTTAACQQINPAWGTVGVCTHV